MSYILYTISSSIGVVLQYDNSVPWICVVLIGPMSYHIMKCTRTPVKVAPVKALQTPPHSPRLLSAHLHRTSSPSTSATMYTCAKFKFKQILWYNKRRCIYPRVNRGIKKKNQTSMLRCLGLSVTVRVNIPNFTSIPGIRIVWLHPCSSRTTGDIAETGELLTDPVSVLVVRVPFTRSCQLPLPATREPIQQQLPNLKKRLLCFSIQTRKTHIHLECNIFTPKMFYRCIQDTISRQVSQYFQQLTMLQKMLLQQHYRCRISLLLMNLLQC